MIRVPDCSIDRSMELLLAKSVREGGGGRCECKGVWNTSGVFSAKYEAYIGRNAVCMVKVVIEYI